MCHRHVDVSCVFLLMLAVILPRKSTQFLSSVQKKWYDGVVPYGYDKFQPPSAKLGEDEAIIECQLTPLSISAMSPLHMSMTADIRMEIRWNDFRLKTEIFDSYNKSFIKLPKRLALQLWFPVFFYFQNCKNCDEIITGQEKNMYYVKNGSSIIFVIRRGFEFICHFSLSFYPFDTQMCYIEVWTGNAELMEYKHDFGGIKYETNILPEFQLVEANITDCTEMAFDEVCTRYNFYLQRDRTRPILVVFIPSSLIVCTSWITFWFDVNMAAERVTIGLTAMLTLVAHFNSVQQLMPAMSTITAQDVWMFGCIIGVFASLMEYAFVRYRRHRENSNQTFTTINVVNSRSAGIRTLQKKCEQCGHFTGRFRRGIANRQATLQKFRKKQKETKSLEETLTDTSRVEQIRRVIAATTMDEFSRIIFPGSFIVFNLFFWSYYYTEVRPKITEVG